MEVCGIHPTFHSFTSFVLDKIFETWFLFCRTDSETQFDEKRVLDCVTKERVFETEVQTPGTESAKIQTGNRCDAEATATRFFASTSWIEKLNAKMFATLL